MIIKFIKTVLNINKLLTSDDETLAVSFIYQDGVAKVSYIPSTSFLILPFNFVWMMMTCYYYLTFWIMLPCIIFSPLLHALFPPFLLKVSIDLMKTLKNCHLPSQEYSSHLLIPSFLSSEFSYKIFLFLLLFIICQV